jgi:hypothetical protein
VLTVLLEAFRGFSSPLKTIACEILTDLAVKQGMTNYSFYVGLNLFLHTYC